jgi:8-oxo-dGTP diphosphatase
MNNSAWEEIEAIYNLPGVDQETVKQFKELQRTQNSYTKKEGNLLHYCSFFLPYDKEVGEMYLGHHIKADDWIPPGGHIESGETPRDAAIREMKEELGVDIGKDMLEPWNLSVKVVNQIGRGCMAHYDVWHLVHIKKQDFTFLRSEYHDARWFGVIEGVKQIQKNPDFAAIVAKLS